VIGAEGQFDWAGNNDGGVTVVGPLGHSFNIVSNDTRIATLAARFGFAVDRALFYGKVGGGWVGNNGFTVTDQNTGQVFVGDTSHTLSGWMAGAGIEYAFSENWSAKIEYDFIGLGGRSDEIQPPENSTYPRRRTPVGSYRHAPRGRSG
jgi:outer membrane immunogenic protein